MDSRVTASLSGNTLLFEGAPWSMIAQIVRTVQKASCGDIKNLKRSGAVCEPLPVKSTAKKYKVFPASSISCWSLFSVPGMGSISARCKERTGRGLICGEIRYNKGPAEKGRALCSVAFLQRKMTGRHGRFN